jgi:stage V sporulation protein G
MTLTVTKISIYPITNTTGKLKALARIVLNDAMQLTSLRIYEGSNGLFVSYPVESDTSGDDFRQLFYPTSKEVREMIENAILDQYYKDIEKL